MRIRTRTIAAALATLALVVPNAALAAEAMPEAIDDPVAAAEPEIDVAEPVQPAGDDVAAQSGAAAEAAGVADATVDAPADAAPATNVAPAAPIVGAGPLPFTGPADGQLVLLLLVGSLFVSAGIVARAFASSQPADA